MWFINTENTGGCQNRHLQYIDICGNNAVTNIIVIITSAVEYWLLIGLLF